MIHLIFCVLSVFYIVSVKSIDVKTTLGPIRGKLVHDELTGVSYNSFEGIPYAEPPVGDLRFQPPVQKQSWTTVYDATKPGRVCPQTELYHSKKEMDEDCLILNIYTPADSLNKSLPVMFSIHDGDFNSQSGNAAPIYGPQLFIQSDLIVVTVNYRLGALGFLSFCTEEISGNAGVKDVLLALKIVHENIIKFGGDPNKVTLRGYGAGSVMAGLLMLTNESKGLFQRALLLGGTVLNSRYIQLNPRDNAVSLVRELGIDSSDSESMVKKLKLVDAFDIVKAQEAISQKDPQRGFRDFKPFTPTVESQHQGAVLTEPFLKMIKDGAIQDIPIVIGFCNQEGLEVFPLLKNDPGLIDKLNNNFELLLPDCIKYPEGSVQRRDLATKVRDFYFSGGNITSVTDKNFINLVTDSQYAFAIDIFVKLFKEKKSAPVYYYIFAGDTELNWFKAFYDIQYAGAAHFDGVGYVFMTSITKSRYPNLDSTSKRLQNSFLQLEKNFAYYGEPSPNSPKLWPEAGKNRNYIFVNNNGSVPVFHSPLPERIGFWSKVFDEYAASAPKDGTYFCTSNDFNGVQ